MQKNRVELLCKYLEKYEKFNKFISLVLMFWLVWFGYCLWVEDIVQAIIGMFCFLFILIQAQTMEMALTLIEYFKENKNTQN